MGYSENIIYDSTINQAILETMANTSFDSTEFLAQQWASMTPVQRSTALLENGYTWQFNNAGEVVGWVRNPMSVTAQNPLHGAETISEGFSYSSAPADYIAGNGLGKTEVVAETSGGVVTKVKTQPLKETTTQSGKTIKSGSAITGINTVVAGMLALQTAGAVYEDWQTNRDWWDDLSDAVFQNGEFKDIQINNPFMPYAFNATASAGGDVAEVLLRRVDDALGLSSYYTYMDENDVALFTQKLAQEGAFTPSDINFYNFPISAHTELNGDRNNIKEVVNNVVSTINSHALNTKVLLDRYYVNLAVTQALAAMPSANCVRVDGGWAYPPASQYRNAYIIITVFNGTNDGSVYKQNDGNKYCSGFGRGYQVSVSQYYNEDVQINSGYIDSVTSVPLGTYHTTDYAVITSNVGASIVQGGIPEHGININPYAQLFVLPDEDTLEAYKQALYDQYPDWYGEGFDLEYYDPTTDTMKSRRYLPISIPTYDPALANYTTPEGYTQQMTQSGQPYPQPNADPLEYPYPYTYPWYAPYTNYIPPTITGYDTPIPTPTPPTPIVPPIVTGSSNGLWSVYNPSFGNLTSLGSYLWSNSIVDIVAKFFANPMDGIISLHQIYCTPSTGASQNIKLGYLDSGVSAPIVTNQYVYIDCGSIPVPAYFLDARDFSPYTKVDLYLPFIGIRTVAPEDIIGCLVNIKYKVDVLTGAVLCEVYVTKRNVTQCLYTYAGNCAVQIPLTAGDRTRLLSGIIGSVAGAVTGGSAGAIAGTMIGGLQQGQSVERTGSYSANSGAMGIKKPYIIVNRKDSYDATGYNRLYGYPINESVTIGGCKGYTKVKDVHVDNIPATSTEKTEIESLLKNGVIIQ